jgi:mannose-6-phosphate isomerase-like protein (cupin superfamily)
MKKLTNENVGGDIVKDNDVYQLRDNTSLKNLVLSSTLLHADKQTTGHKHEGQEEVYFFVSGFGEMSIDDERFSVKPGDIVLIEDGEFHRVYNTSQEDLYFVCVFDGNRNH